MRFFEPKTKNDDLPMREWYKQKVLKSHFVICITCGKQMGCRDEESAIEQETRDRLGEEPPNLFFCLNCRQRAEKEQ